MDSLMFLKKNPNIIRENDLLLIKVYSTSISQEETKIYNTSLEAYNVGTELNNGIKVDESGSITLPQIGKIKVSGLTQEQIESKIQQELKKYIKDLGVTVRQLTFDVIVLGEVGKSGRLNLAGTRNTIIDVIAGVGLSENSRRDSILLIREENGIRKTYSYDLRTGEVFNSPFFYLKQNDIVYILPTQKKLRELGADSEKRTDQLFKMQVATTFIGIFSILLNIFFLLRPSN